MNLYEPLGSRKGFFQNGKGLTRTETLGHRLTQARLNYGARRGRFISQAELAEMIGLTGQSVGNYEAGRTEPSYEIVRKLARVLGVTAGFLAFGEETVVIPPHTVPTKPLPELEALKPSRKRRA